MFWPLALTLMMQTAAASEKFDMKTGDIVQLHGLSHPFTSFT